MLVSLCVIAYNEEKSIKGLLKDIREQTFDHKRMEVILVNNGSTDRTGRIMEEFAENQDFYNVIVLRNKKSNQATGWNTAFLNSAGDIIIKVDAHSEIPENFVEMNVKVILSGEDVCGGGRPNITEGDTPFENTLLVAEECMFGGKFATYRNKQNRKRYVNSIFNGAYKSEVFAKVGGFNEALGRTEDNEFHYRITKAGYRICCSPNIVSYQYIRSSFLGMLKQKFDNGLWIGGTVKVYPKCLSWFHFVPFVFVLSLIICTVVALLWNSILLILLLCSYLLFDLYITYNSFKSEKRCTYFFLLPLMFPMLHISYGLGTLVGIIKSPVRKANLNKAKKRIRQVKSYFSRG